MHRKSMYTRQISGWCVTFFIGYLNVPGIKNCYNATRTMGVSFLQR